MTKIIQSGDEKIPDAAQINIAEQVDISSILASVPEAIWSVDSLGRFLYFNPALLRLLEIESLSDEDSLQTLWRFVHPADVLRLEHALKELAVNDTVEVEFRIHIREGKQRWLLGKASVICNEHGEVIHYDGICQDISVYKRTEDLLRTSEQRWALALEGVNDGLWDWDTSTNRVFYSSRWKSMLGYEDHEIGDMLDEWALRVHPDDKEFTLEKVKQHLEGRTPYYQSEHRVRCKDDSYKWILDRGRAIRNEQGEVIRMVGAHTDMTERKEFEETLLERNAQLDAFFRLSPDGFLSIDRESRVRLANPAFYRLTGLKLQQVCGEKLVNIDKQLRERTAQPDYFLGLASCFENIAVDGMHIAHTPLVLRYPEYKVITISGLYSQISTAERLLYLRDITRESEIDRMKSEFLSSAAHELRSPMTSIYGFSELLLLDEQNVEQHREIAQIIHQQTNHLVTIINELLDLSRIESLHTSDLNCQLLILSDLIHRTLSGLLFNTAILQVKIDSGSQIKPVSADTDKLQQALTNILSNAFKYSPQGGVIDIDFPTMQSDGQEFQGVRIRDQGIGMSPDQVRQAFTRFYRANARSEIPGTGLGLSIVKEIIQLHGGNVEIASVLGQGTAVTIWLPISSGDITS